MTKKNIQRKCAQCAKSFSASEETKSLLPFCSSRCKMIDLGKWLGEEYSVADREVEASTDYSVFKDRD